MGSGAETGARCGFEPADPHHVCPGARGFLRLVDGTGPAAVYARHGAGMAGVPRIQGARAGQRESEALRRPETGAYNGLLDPAAAQAIRDIHGAAQRGVRTGNWLTKRQAEALLAAPDATTDQGKRDRAILAVLVGCGLHRDEAVRLTFAHIQQRDGRWCVVDLVGKKGRYRTVPMPAWTKIAIDSWAAAAGMTGGPVFRGVNKGDVVMGGAAEHAGHSARRGALCRRDRAARSPALCRMPDYAESTTLRPRP